MTTYLSERITINPEQCGGRPCIRGMRIRVIDVLELMAAGLSHQEILQELPDLEMEDIHAVLKFDRRQKEHRIRSAAAAVQKGIYHLYVLKNNKSLDAFDDVLRRYQSTYLLGVTQILLDFGKTIEPKNKRIQHLAGRDPAAGVVYCPE